MGQVAACGVVEAESVNLFPFLSWPWSCHVILCENRADISRVTTAKLQTPEAAAAFRGCSAGRVMANTHQQMPWHFQVQPPFWEQLRFTVLA